MVVSLSVVSAQSGSKLKCIQGQMALYGEKSSPVVDRPVSGPRQQFLICRVGVAEHRASRRVTILVLSLPPEDQQMQVNCDFTSGMAEDIRLLQESKRGEREGKRRWVINGGKLVEMGEKWVRGRQRPVFAQAVVGEKVAIHR